MNYRGIAENLIDLAWDELNQWEKDFIRNVYDNATTLSKHQKKKLKEIQNDYLKY